MRPGAIKSALAANLTRDLRRQNAGLKRQLEETVAALARARRTKTHRIPTGRSAVRLKGDRIRVIIPDTHGAHADLPALSAALADIKTLNPHEVILLGDHVDCGGFLAEHHTLCYVAEADYSYEDDIKAANVFLNRLQASAPNARLDYIEGNHERRVETWCLTQTLRNQQDGDFLRRSFHPEFLLDLAGRGIAYHRLDRCHDGLSVPGVIKRGKIFFFHGISTAKHATAVTQGAVAGNCVFGHTHRHQADVVRRMSAGIVGAWNPGCLCRMQPLWNHGKPTDWTHGYAIQIVRPNGNFLHLNVPIIGGHSHLGSLLKT